VINMIETLISGITYSSLLSLMALGITLLYRTTKVPNFAHASFVVFGIYTSYTLALLGYNPYLGTLLGFIVSGIIALILFYALLEPLRRRKSSIFILMMATLTYDILMFGIINIYADYLETTFKIPARNVYLAPQDFTLIGLKGVSIVSTSLLIVLLMLLYILLNRTIIGAALRAVMENPSLAQANGINVSLMLALSWFLAGGLAGVAGALLPMYMMTDPSTGMLLIAPMFCASVLGGLEQIYGAPLGGFILGLATTVLVSWLSGVIGYWIMTYSLMVPYITLIITLIFIPRGVVSIILKR